MIPELKAALMLEPCWTVAVAESLTVGRVQTLLGSISGASNYFLGGVTAYTLEQKVKLLGVDRDTAAACNCVSAEVARQMAIGALRLFGSDWSIATTGYAEKSSEPFVEEPYAWWAVGRRRGEDVEVFTGEVICPGLERIAVQTQITLSGLEALLTCVREARGLPLT